MGIDRPAARNVVIAVGTGVFVVALASVGRAINVGLVSLVGDNILTQVNRAIAIFIIDNALVAFFVVAGVTFVVGVIEDRRDRDETGP